MTAQDDQQHAISPPITEDSPSATRARQGVISFRIVTVLVISMALAAAAMGLAYLFF